MILSFIEKLEDAISSSPIVVNSNIQKYFSSSKKEAYVKGKLTFIDLSFLDFSIFAVEKGRRLILDKYRYQYMDSKKKLIFRYDNASHHKEISTFPIHKHLRDKVVESPLPNIEDILGEIGTLIIQTIK